MRTLKQSTAKNVMVFMTDATDPLAGLAGLTLTVTLSKNGAAFAAMSGGAATDRGNGWYSVPLDTTDTNTLGELAAHVTATGANTLDFVVGEVVTGLASELYDILIADRGTAQAGGAATLTLATTASATDGTYRGMSVAIISGTGAGQSRQIDAYTGASRVAFLCVGWNTVPDNTSVYVVLRAADLTYLKEIGVLTYGAVDTVEASLTTLFARLFADSGTAQSGNVAYITLQAGASANNAAYVGCSVYIVSGTGVGQIRTVEAYDGSTKRAYPPSSRPFSPAPDNTSVYVVLNTANGSTDDYLAGTYTTVQTINTNVSDIETAVGGLVNVPTDIAAVQADTNDIQTRLPAALVGGRMDSSVGAMAANVITAAATAADFGTEIATAVWAVAHESGRTILGVMRRLDAVFTGKATGLRGTLATFFRSDGTTKAIEFAQDTTAGTRDQATTVGGD